VDSRPVGRDGAIAEIGAFLSATSGGPAALALTGDAGIGKTMVWKHVIQTACRSSRVLSCQPTLSERPLAFSALDDLLGDVADEVLPALPGPRRLAVAVALLREAPPGRPPASRSEAGRPQPEGRVLARGVLDALRLLSDRSPLVIAVDDAQWLDQPSASVLEFCFRRLAHERVTILLTSRGGDKALPLGLDRSVPPDRLRLIRLGPLSLGAIGEIVRSRQGAALPRYTLTRLYEACGGNPFFALECAHALAGDRRISHTNEPIPLPRSLSDLVLRRMRQLKPDVRWLGQLVAASSDPRERLIRAACDDGESWAAIELAINDGIIERDGDMLRFTHPLLRSGLYGEMTLDQRKAVHQRLGAVAEGVEERAWHLALGADRPSGQTARMLDDAARHAASRGAPEAAAALQEHATKLTPADRPQEIRERTVHAADFHFRAGSLARSQELIESALAGRPGGQSRGSLLLRLAAIHYHRSGWQLAEKTLRLAADHAQGDPGLRAHAEQELAFARLVAGDLPAASRWARVSLRSAKQAADPGLMAQSLSRIALFDFLQGDGVRPELLNRAEALAESAREGRLRLLDPCLVTGLILKWCDDLDEARLKLADRYRHALDRGHEASLPFLLYHFSQLECWAGNWDLAEEYALEACRVADESRQQPMRPATLYALALVRAHRGKAQDARELASEALTLCEHTGNVPITNMAASVLGFVALSLGDHQGAHAHLGRLAEATAGLGEPGVVKFLPDEIEALAGLGELDLAWTFTRQFEARAESLGRPWALATAARCRAQLAAADGDLEGARAACERALSQHERLAMPFELGRTLLVKGMIERRSRGRSAALASLGQALGIFEHLGAPLWAEKAHGELAKIAAGRPVSGLTETEHRVATLVVRGQTNREVATAMFVTENTVQTHLRHIFQKLGVRSRTELAAQLLSAPASTSTP
jgi:DNA-binding CsgD family transcriptional regulator